MNILSPGQRPDEDPLPAEGPWPGRGDDSRTACRAFAGLAERLTDLEDLQWPTPLAEDVLPRRYDMAGVSVRPGQIWTIAAPGGVGATMLAVQIAVEVARSRRVRFANNHLAPHLTRNWLLAQANFVGLDVARLAAIELATWLPVPGSTSELNDSWEGGDDTALLVYDTVDEMFVWYWEADPQTRMQSARRLRELARQSNTAVLLTARVSPPRAQGHEAFCDAWSEHWARPVFADISDVAIEVWRPANVVHGAEVEIGVRERGCPGWRGGVGVIRSGAHVLIGSSRRRET